VRVEAWFAIAAAFSSVPPFLPQANAYVMIRRRAAAAGIETKLGNHSFPADRDQRLSQEPCASGLPVPRPIVRNNGPLV